VTLGLLTKEGLCLSARRGERRVGCEETVIVALPMSESRERAIKCNAYASQKEKKIGTISGIVKQRYENVGYCDTPHAPGIKMTSREALSSSVAVGTASASATSPMNRHQKGRPSGQRSAAMVKPRTFCPRSVLILELRLFDAPDAFRQ
jgi:hypothetical protein